MRPIPSCFWISAVLFAASAGSAGAQAVTEYDAMAHKSATVGAKAHHITSEINGIWKSLDNTAKTGTDHSGSQQISAPAGTKPRTPLRSGAIARGTPTGNKYEDPHQIAPGMTYEELIRRFGPPSFGVLAGPGSRSLTYFSKHGSIDLELRDDKVVKVTAPKPQEVAAAAPR